jgi:hypothetical protein
LKLSEIGLKVKIYMDMNSMTLSSKITLPEPSTMDGYYTRNNSAKSLFRNLFSLFVEQTYHPVASLQCKPLFVDSSHILYTISSYFLSSLVISICHFQSLSLCEPFSFSQALNPTWPCSHISVSCFHFSLWKQNFFNMYWDML